MCVHGPTTKRSSPRRKGRRTDLCPCASRCDPASRRRSAPAPDSVPRSASEHVAGGGKGGAFDRPDAASAFGSERHHGLFVRGADALGQAAGIQVVQLGMAPCRGLRTGRWRRRGTSSNVVFRYGEHFYNFQGLRQYKEKFEPQWQPRYLACPPRAGAAANPRQSGNAYFRRLRGVVTKG